MGWEAAVVAVPCLPRLLQPPTTLAVRMCSGDTTLPEIRSRRSMILNEGHRLSTDQSKAP